MNEFLMSMVHSWKKGKVRQDNFIKCPADHIFVNSRTFNYHAREKMNSSAEKSTIDPSHLKTRIEEIRTYFSENDQNRYAAVDQLLQDFFDDKTEFGNHNRSMLKEKLNKHGLSLCWLLYGKGQMKYKEKN